MYIDNYSDKVMADEDMEISLAMMVASQSLLSSMDRRINLIPKTLIAMGQCSVWQKSP
jgi:hypothetical protein